MNQIFPYSFFLHISKRIFLKHIIMKYYLINNDLIKRERERTLRFVFLLIEFIIICHILNNSIYVGLISNMSLIFGLIFLKSIKNI